MVKKALSFSDAKKKRYNLLKINHPEYDRHLGTMELTGSVLIKGGSGNGKTTYMLKLVKVLCKQEPVHICTPEESGRHSFFRALELNNMEECGNRFSFSADCFDELYARLKRKRQKKIIVIDSIQVFFKGKKRDDYYKLINSFPDTLFIGISKVNSKGDVVGAVADEFHWDCQNRIRVEDFQAYLEKTRCGGDQGTPLIISKVKAQERGLKIVKNA
jgi:archaellum biogenesis ATPase FlaH